MEFRTVVDIRPSVFRIEPFARMLFVGSCFADSMGRRFKEECFRVEANPYGVMYNPASILHTVERTAFVPDVAVFTLGTNHVYILKESGEIVDNCRKRPQHLFEEKELGVDECAGFLSAAIDLLRQRNPEVRIILTVSPIRYAKYGFHGSQLSKATLLLATESVQRKYAGKHDTEGCVSYFPAYEIVNDELRDYRFYCADMIHPTEQAVEYIWQRFSETHFSEKAIGFMKEWKPIKAALRHRPFHPESETYRQFMEDTTRKIKELSGRYPDFRCPDMEVPEKPD